MSVMRFAICGIFAALCLTAVWPVAAQEMLAPNKPLLGTPSESPPQAATSPAPSESPVLSANPTAPGSLNLTTQNQPTAAESGIDPKDIPEIILQEMTEAEQNCNNNNFYSSFHDCKCLAAKFVDARLKSDPSVPKERIFDELTPQCVNEAGVAGYIYQGCASYMATVRKDYVSFCTCTANDVARAYTRAPVMNFRYVEMLRRNAFMNCGIANNPDYVSPYSR